MIRRAVIAGVAIAVATLVASCGVSGAAAPDPTTTWQYQLQGPIDTRVAAGTFDVDLFTTPSDTVRQLKADGRSVICYLNAGAIEQWRPDARALPPEVRGEQLDGWPGEHWLDVRRSDVLEPFLAARLDQCRDKGFDGVEPDNVDGFANDTGFGLTADDQLAFNRMVARLAHQRGLTVGLKNDLDQVGDLVDEFDFAVTEQCAEYRECDALAPFVQQGKPVFHVEYSLPLDRFCPPPAGFRSIRKPADLGAPVEPCPPAQR